MIEANGSDSWEALQEGARTCTKCAALNGMLFVPFVGDFPRLPRPEPKPSLFISEAPPREGGFWKIPTPGKREDDLREKLLPLLGLSTQGPERGLPPFVAAGFFLLQAFPRPLKFSIGSVGLKDLREMLEHPVSTHIGPMIRGIAPRAIVTLGRPAAAAVAMTFPASEFAAAFTAGGLEGVHGRVFAEGVGPAIGASYLPSGAGRFNRDRWAEEIPRLVTEFPGARESSRRQPRRGDLD